MLRTVTALAALALALAAPASADVRFEGNIKFTKKTTTCNSSIKLGIVWRSRFHPGITLLPGNDNWTGINRVEDFSAQAWGRDSDFTTSFQKVSNGVLSHKFVGINGNDILLTKSFLKLNALPTVMNSGTETVKLNGRIKNPFGTATQTDCIVDFTAIYQNRDLAAP